MQFTGKRGIAVFVSVILGAGVVGFGSGLLVGRQFPAHRYEKFGNTSYLLDPTTGKVCNPFANANPIDATLGYPNLPPGFVLEGTQDANGFQVVKPAVPACGK
jgi:hypothetical protein